MPDLRVALLTREYPPEVYGGAGVHVEYLARELAKLVDLTVHCFGEPRPGDAVPRAVAHPSWATVDDGSPHADALKAISVDLSMASAVAGASLVHSHTWY